MRAFVAGATGVLGRRVVAGLVEGGHEVTAVARSPAKSAELGRIGARPAEVDVFDPRSVASAVAGSEVVCNLATHIPPASKMILPGAWKENDRIRRELSRNLVDGAVAASADRYIQESIAFLYADQADRWIDEDTPLDPAPYMQSALAAEDQARRFAATGRTGVVLRFGLFYGPDASHSVTTVKAARRGLASSFGEPDAYASSIHIEDAAAAVLAALNAPSGVYNVVDDEPLTRRQLNEALAAAVGREKITPPPVVLTKMAGNRVAALARSQRVSNRLFKDATGWHPRYRSVREGWPATVAAMQT